MGKKRIGWLYGKPIVIGDKNLLTKNETHTEQLKASSGNHYYKLLEGEMAKQMLGILGSAIPFDIILPGGKICSLYSYANTSSTSTLFAPINYPSFPLGIRLNDDKVTAIFADKNGDSLTIEYPEGGILDKVIGMMGATSEVPSPENIAQIKTQINMAMKEITKEEWYNLK